MTIDVPPTSKPASGGRSSARSLPRCDGGDSGGDPLAGERQKRAESLRASVAAGLAAIERGEGSELTPELWAEIDRDVDEKIRRGLPLNPDVCP
jgi:hypothetical protein